MSNAIIFTAIAGLALGGLIGWLLGGRGAGVLRSERDFLRVERDAHLERFKQAAIDLEAADREREAHRVDLATMNAARDGDVRAHAAQVEALTSARDALSAQFQDVATKLLTQAQAQFLDSAGARFKASEQEAGHRLSQLLAPVNERLQRYEIAVDKVEKERQAAFGNLHGLMESLRHSNEGVKAEAARLSNSLRNAPKARGRWGEQQLRNVLESCGLSEHADFQTEVSVAGDDGGRLRPDVIIRIPGGQSLVIDAKVSLNAYQDAFNAEDEGARAAGLAAHTASVRTHINSLGNKAYWAQFDSAPDYVILFIPGEHFLSAALETDPTLWDFAFDKRVLLATPTNLIAIARTVSAVWRQESLTRQAAEIAGLGKDLYARLSVMGAHIGRLGKNLDTAVGAYNQFVGSFESQVLTQARRFEALDVDTGGKTLDALPVAETAVRAQTKLPANEG
ncbi:MAG: DNA recombination protein RmuC [Pseudomonadota bacterium]